MRRMNTTEGLAHTRAAIVRWERKLRLAAGKLKRYRAKEKRLLAKAAQEIQLAVKGPASAGRKFDLES